MASSPAPTTPENAPRRSVMNRSATAPIRTSPSIAGPRPPPEIGATEGVETLYTHPNASIVKFTTLSSRPSSSSPGRQQGGPALLPWTSATERTVAAGPLQVYRVPGSVSFLNSGTLLHAILPRSQCWCVDGVSKFALRVLPDTYYRIELPGETQEDKEEVERLKLTLQKVCFYERTPCPFERGFDVEIKDEADLTVRKKRRKSHGPAKKWKLDRQHSWKPEGWQPEEERGSADEGSGSGVGSDVGSEDESTSTSGREDSGGEEKGEALSDQVRPQPKPTTPSRVQGARKLFEQRSVTAPAAQLTLQSPPPSRLRTRVDVDGTVEVAEPAVEGASERETPRQRTFQAIPTDMPPSPPDSSAGLEQAELRGKSSNDQLDVQASEGADPRADREELQDEQITEQVEDGEDDTVIIHDVEAASEATAQESKADDALEESRQDAPQTASELPDNGEDDSTQSRNTDIPMEPDSAKDEPLPASETPDREIHRPKSMNSDNPGEPEQRPTTPPPPPIVSDRRPSDPFTTSSPPTASARSSSPTRSDYPPKPRSDSSNQPEDPFAAIQARILARRSIGGTTSFHPPQPPLTASSSSSSGSASSTLSRRSHSHSSHQHQQAFATAMVKKACSVFLGPPAHLVAIMLRIAARFAKGAFGVDGVFYVESPADVRGRVPGSYQVFANGEVEGLDGLHLEREEELEEWEEDDFGVPLRSPVRLASMSSLRRSESQASEGLRERSGRAWEVD